MPSLRVEPNYQFVQRSSPMNNSRQSEKIEPMLCESDKTETLGTKSGDSALKSAAPEVPSESWMRRWLPVLVGDLLLAGVLTGAFWQLGESREDARADRADQLEDSRADRANRLEDARADRADQLEEARAERAQHLEDERTESSDKRAMQQTLYLAYLRGIVMPSEDLSHLSFGGRDMTGADLWDADLRQARLIGTRLVGADLSDANLAGADLFRANLSESYAPTSNLSGTKLVETDLSLAYLRGADLSGADLSGTNLTGADLTEAKLSGAKWNPTAQPPTWPDGFAAPKNAWHPESDG